MSVKLKLIISYFSKSFYKFILALDENIFMNRLLSPKKISVQLWVSLFATQKSSNNNPKLKLT